MARRHPNARPPAPIGTVDTRDGVHTARAAAQLGVRGDRAGEKSLRLERGKQDFGRELFNSSITERTCFLLFLTHTLYPLQVSDIFQFYTQRITSDIHSEEMQVASSTSRSGATTLHRTAPPVGTAWTLLALLATLIPWLLLHGGTLADRSKVSN